MLPSDGTPLQHLRLHPALPPAVVLALGGQDVQALVQREPLNVVYELTAPAGTVLRYEDSLRQLAQLAPLPLPPAHDRPRHALPDRGVTLVSGLLALAEKKITTLHREITALSERKDSMEAQSAPLWATFKGLEPYQADGKDYLLTPEGWTIIHGGTLGEKREAWRIVRK